MNGECEIKTELQSMRLYAIISEAHCSQDWQDTVQWVLQGGADVVQLREKELSDAELLGRARWIQNEAHKYGKLCIINDRPDIALLAGAHGVHLGQDDLAVEDVRELVGPDVIVGKSTHSVEQAEKASASSADYIGVGPVFATETKGYETGGGVELVSDVVGATNVPVVAIGGIGAYDARRVIHAGAQAIAVCSALCGSADPESAAEEFIQQMQEVDSGKGNARCASKNMCDEAGGD